MTIETSIRLRCNKALEKGWSVGLCRTPDDSTIKLFVSTKTPDLIKIDLNKITSRTFVFAPYGSGSLAYAIVPDYYYENEFPVLEKDHLLNGALLENEMWHSSSEPLNITAKEQYMAYVEETVKQIKKKELLKSVAARNMCIELPKKYDVLNHFFEMCQQFPSAHVYLFSSSISGTWIGATPELLLSCTNGLLKSVALAGTKQFEDKTPWSEKEKQEHYFVEAFIDDVFEQLKLQRITLSEIEEKQAGQIKHLYSIFTWKTKDEELKKKFHKVLSLINPTPAVCGLPPLEAAMFISKNEQIERRFYSGFTGVIDGTENTQIFVTLRCMEVIHNKAILYAGAGITIDSNPESEWMETTQKMQTLGLLE